ncbi:uncharacterized protein PHALS_02607 [Plasmopara halstedii]|uniref:Uncharacterized protein n=1 Tax=Plasmopara halstedii TaxID=4781 RepID=A0A0P1AXE4_PLAHL|nr:uncharacterized protein PHALS_02607 [Plasmopara halstedii]CEG46192.1 hypothetical protein PHALS_02607 [Plasmopara halstedii]|eukprot:XP_024582561.1 hypothetical protein PHALS_02607 [Plasmopara halstedii]
MYISKQTRRVTFHANPILLHLNARIADLTTKSRRDYFPEKSGKCENDGSRTVTICLEAHTS